jgi:trans-2,3-dihydro-3-hydroxyanthranilate isomerase
MAAYLWHYQLISSPKFIVEQGHWLRRLGEAEIEVFGAPNEISGVRLGGESQLLISGTINL